MSLFDRGAFDARLAEILSREEPSAGDVSRSGLISAPANPTLSIAERGSLADDLGSIEVLAPRPSRRELAARIQAMADEGRRGREIAKALGITRQRVQRIADQFDLRLQPIGGRRRRVRAAVSEDTYRTVSELAEIARVTPSEMISRLLDFATESGLQRAAKELGKAARPKRAYRKRTVG